MVGWKDSGRILSIIKDQGFLVGLKGSDRILGAKFKKLRAQRVQKFNRFRARPTKKDLNRRRFLPGRQLCCRTLNPKF